MKKLVALFISFFFSLSSVSAQTFTDVDPSYWSYSYIEDLVAQGIVDTGYFFHPDRYLTRAELVKMMVIATTGVLDDRLPEFASFPDVSVDEWYYPYIETAKMTGLINGYPDGLFRPGQPVIRAEAVKIIVNGLGIPKSNDPPVRFRDYDLNAWFHIYVASAFNKDIISGKLNNKGQKQMIFSPEEAITRAQMAKIVSNGLAISTLY